MRGVFLWAALLLAVGPACVRAQSSPWREPARHCQILDCADDALYTFGLGYVADADIDGFGHTGLVEWDAHWDLAYFHDVLLGNVDIAIDVGCRMLTNPARLRLPDRLVALAADLEWTWRYVNDTALQVRARPGIYSTLQRVDGSDIYVPFAVVGILRLADSCSAQVGMWMRPGFERVLLPVGGVVWSPIPEIRIEAMLPASRAEVFWSRDWSMHARWAWESETYGMHERGHFRRQTITLEAYRAALGATHRITDEFYVTGELGMASERSIALRHVRGVVEQVDIDPSVFIRVALAGPF
jgi:hypothetical protein